MNIVEVYDRLNKTMLIKSYRRYLEENEKFSTKKKKEGKYPHPIVNGKQLSWTQFGKLPRDAILVFILTDGCDLTTCILSCLEFCVLLASLIISQIFYVFLYTQYLYRLFEMMNVCTLNRMQLMLLRL